MLQLGPALMWLPTLLLATLRVAGMVAFAPVLGDAAVPIKVRVILSAAMGLGAVGRLAQPVPLPPGALDLLLVLGCEFLLGAVIGYTARLIFTGVQLGAFHVGSQMGLALGEVANPLSGEAASAVGGLFRLLAVVIFLAIGGHRALVGGLMQTFRVVPPAGFAPADGLIGPVVAMLAASFVLALKVAAPVLIALLVATVALGLLHKTVPQCNLLSIGLPVRAMLGLLVLAASLGVLAPLIEAAAGRLGRSIQTLTAAVR
jgi:flagellar biosynthetic protein FliR